MEYHQFEKLVQQTRKKTFAFLDEILDGKEPENFSHLLENSLTDQHHF
jgi:hypothetical protein